MQAQDKAALREDYARGMTQRALGEKYGVPRSTVGDWARREGWTREKGSDGTDYEAVRSLARKVMRRTDALLDADDSLTARDLKSACSLLLDVRNLLGVTPPQEQEERVIEVRFVETDGAEN